MVKTQVVCAPGSGSRGSPATTTGITAILSRFGGVNLRPGRAAGGHRDRHEGSHFALTETHREALAVGRSSPLEGVWLDWICAKFVSANEGRAILVQNPSAQESGMSGIDLFVD